MALTYGFYNSYAGDRKYDAMQISEMFDGILADGIIPSQGQLFAVTAGGGMTVNVGTGRAWFFHSWTKNDSVMMLTVPASDVSRPRIDAVVLEVNRDQEVRANSIKIVSGEAAVNPVKPTLVTTDKVRQYPLAYITVGAGVEEIKAENIENAVGLTPTPFATGVLETTPLDELWSQWEGEWDTWFANIKLQLSGDIVANLQGQIDALEEKVEKNSEDIKWLEEKADLVAKNLAKIIVKTKLNGNIIGDVQVSGLYDSDGIALPSDKSFTDEQGRIIAYLTAGSSTISISAMLDLNASTQTLIAEAGKKYEITFDLTNRTYLLLESSTTMYATSNCESFTGTMVGGGGGGGKGAYTGGAGGGGGGFTRIPKITISPRLAYVFKVAGGGGGGGGGGSTSFLDFVAGGGGGGASGSENTESTIGKLHVGGDGGSGDIIGPKGGSYVYGNPNAGYSKTGGAGMSGFYASLTETTSVSGGGGIGSGATDSSPIYAGGSPGGGSGGARGIRAESGKTYGGGGGGAQFVSSYNGGSGYRGAIGLRLVLKAFN